MYNTYNNYPYPNQMSPWHSRDRMYDCGMYPNPYFYNNPMINRDYMDMYPNRYPYNQKNSIYDSWYLQYSGNDGFKEIKDYGPNPFVINIEEATEQNNTFRTSLWTGDHLQLTLMSLNVGEDIGLEMHPDVDQFVRIEEGRGVVTMGDSEDMPNFEESVYEDFIFIIPAGKWHNLTNTGNKPLKLYSIYAPPQHPHGTVHKTKAEAEAAHNH